MNPFQPAPGATPPALAGREAELASIDDACERISRGSVPVPLVFLGLRGLGKTVLLNEVRAQTAAGVHLRIEVESGVTLATSTRRAFHALQASLEPVAKRFAKDVEAALRHLPLPAFELPNDMGAIKLSAAQPDTDDEQHPIGEAIGLLNAAAVAAKRYLVITIDEVQDADIGGYRSIVAAVHQSAGTASPILLASAGLPETANVLEHLRTYAKRWDRFDLGFLTRAESVEAIRMPLSDSGVTIEDRALDRLVEESAGYPFFVQKYASAAWNRHEGDTITEDDVAAAIPGVRAMVEKSFYEDQFRSLSPRERLFCKTLADFGAGPHGLGETASELGMKSSGISSIRGNLIKKGILFAPSSGFVQFRMPLADRYVREHPAFFFDDSVKRYHSTLKHKTTGN